MTVRTISTETIKPGKEEIGKGDTWENKEFKSSHMHLGIKKATCMPRVGCVLRKNPEKILNSHLWLAFRFCASRM